MLLQRPQLAECLPSRVSECCLPSLAPRSLVFAIPYVRARFCRREKLDSDEATHLRAQTFVALKGQRRSIAPAVVLSVLATGPGDVSGMHASTPPRQFSVSRGDASAVRLAGPRNPPMTHPRSAQQMASSSARRWYSGRGRAQTTGWPGHRLAGECSLGRPQATRTAPDFIYHRGGASRTGAGRRGAARRARSAASDRAQFPIH